MELSQRLDLGALNLGNVEQETDQDDQSVMARLVRLIAEVAGVDAEAVTADRTLAETGVSSLDRIELAVRAEDLFGVRAEEGPYTDQATVGEIAEWIAAHDDVED